jgi:hypothetical protein
MLLAILYNHQRSAVHDYFEAKVAGVRAATDDALLIHVSPGLPLKFTL